MHGLSFGSKNNQKCAYHGRVDICEYEIPAKKNMCFLFQEGSFNGQMGIGMYEMTVICLDGSKNAFVVCRSFYEMVYEMRETHRNKKVGGGAGQNFYGEIKAWRVGLVGRGNFTPPTS